MRKRLILVTAVMMSFAFVSNAQNHKSRKGNKENRGKRLDSIAQVYGLNETQKTKFKEALIVRKKAQKALRDKTKPAKDRRLHKAEFKQIKATFDSSVKATFTADQYTRYKADMDKRKLEKRTAQLEKGSTRIADTMKAKYGLTADQHTRIKAAAKSFGSSKLTIRKKYTTAENKEEAKKEIKVARQQLDASIKTILTEDQYAQWKADKKGKRKSKKKK